MQNFLSKLRAEIGPMALFSIALIVVGAMLMAVGAVILIWGVGGTVVTLAGVQLPPALAAAFMAVVGLVLFMIGMLLWVVGWLLLTFAFLLAIYYFITLVLIPGPSGIGAGFPFPGALPLGGANIFNLLLMSPEELLKLGPQALALVQCLRGVICGGAAPGLPGTPGEAVDTLIADLRAQLEEAHRKLTEALLRGDAAAAAYWRRKISELEAKLKELQPSPGGGPTNTGGEGGNDVASRIAELERKLDEARKKLEEALARFDSAAAEYWKNEIARLESELRNLQS